MSACKMRMVRKGICPKNIDYTNYSIHLSRGVGICRFEMAVENLLES